MKRRFLFLFFFTILLGGCENGLYSGTLIFEGEHTFGTGVRLPGDVFVRAGEVEFRAGSQVAGSVYMMGGSLIMNGEIDGDLALLGGSLTLGPLAEVTGDLRLGGGELDRGETAVVHGDIITGSSVQIPAFLSEQERNLDDWLRILSASLLLAGLGALLIRGKPRPIINVGDAVVDNALLSGATGLLMLLVLPALLVMMVFTIILIPLVIIIGVLLFLLLGFGLVAVGHRLGVWLSRQLKWKVTPVVATFGGTLLLLLLFEIPYLGDSFVISG